MSTNRIQINVPLTAIAEATQMNSGQVVAFTEAWATIMSCKTDLNIEESTAWIHQSDYATAIKTIHAYLVLNVIPKYFLEQYRCCKVSFHGRLLEGNSELLLEVEAMPEG